MTSAFACPDIDVERHCLSGWTRLDFGRVPPFFNLASSCFAMAGAVLIIFSYVCFRDFQTGSRKVITFLAVANFFQACGCSISSLLYIVYVGLNIPRSDPCYVFDTMCQLLAFCTWWATISSFIWSIVLALYLYFALVKGRILLVNNSWIVLHVVTTILPLTVMLPFLVLGVFGYSPFTYGGGCFIKTIVKDSDVHYLFPSTFSTVTLKLIEIASYIAVGILFFLIFRFRIMPGPSLKDVKTAPLPVHTIMDHKLILIPVLFIILRIWGTILNAASIALDYSEQIGVTACAPNAVYYSLYVLNVLQAVGDPGQGWGNALVFVFLSAKVRHKLFLRPLKLLFNQLLLIKSRGNPIFSSGVLHNVTPNANNVQGSVNSSDFVKKHYFVSSSRSAESPSDFEVIPTPESDTATEAPVTPAEIYKQIL